MLRFECNHRNLLLLTVAALFGLGAMTVGVVFVLHEHELDEFGVRSTKTQGAVASNAYECAPVGADILREGGSAADAAIAMMICEEVACPESAGIGGGFLATIYDREKGTVEVLDAREVAANGAREDMFVGNGEAAVHGGLAIATPGALKGYWVMHQRYGKLPWKRLIEPSIDLCYRGHIVNPYMADAMQEIREEILNTTSLREIFVDPETGDIFKEGDVIKRPDFARTLEVIAVEGADAVAATGTINDYFGAQLRSPSNGIIPNGEMDDFSTPGVINIYGVPASPANFIAPKKRPLSSMSPAIVIDDAGDVRLIAGGAGGTRITTATLQLILRHAFFGEDLMAAMGGPRVHHQLAPMWIEYEAAVDVSIVEQLKARGHAVKKVRRVATETAVARERDGRVSAAFDPRRPGSAEVVEG